MNPEIHRHISFDAYRAWDDVNASSLKSLLESPATYLHTLSNPFQPSAAMALGTAVHAALLEPDAFASYVAFEGTRRGKAWDEFQAEHAGSPILKTEELDLVHAIRNSVLAHPAANALLTGPGDNELSLRWVDPGTGISCKARLDRLCVVDGTLWLPDVKTTRDSSPAAFGRAAWNLHYLLQGACYAYAVEQCGLGENPRVAYVAVDTTPGGPHETAVYYLTEEQLGIGRSQYFAALSTLKSCRESGQFPVACPVPTPLVLPSWAYSSDDDSDYLED